LPSNRRRRSRSSSPVEVETPDGGGIMHDFSPTLSPRLYVRTKGGFLSIRRAASFFLTTRDYKKLKRSTTTTSDARRPSRRMFLLRRPVFGRAYRANVLQVTILINLQFGPAASLRPADVFRFVCLPPCMPAGASLNRYDPRTHTPQFLSLPHPHMRI